MTTREELLETLRRLAVEQGPNITLYRFREETGISRNIVYDRWGNWTNLRVAAGLPRRVTIAPVYTEDELLGEFHAAVREINRYPRLGEFSRLSDRSWNTPLRSQVATAPWRSAFVGGVIFANQFCP